MDTQRQQITEMIYRLDRMDTLLAELIMDAQERCEEQVKREGGRFDDYAQQDDGSRMGIVYMENAAPELDNARSNIQDAVENLRELLEQGK